MTSWRERLRAAGIHFGISLAVAALAALLVFALWYPYPYREISGGRELFLLVVAVDVVLGPLITLAVFNLAKGWPSLRRDLAVVGLLQLAGLAYGLWSVQLARPVHLVFEIDRFRVVHAVDVPTDLLDRTPAGIDVLPLAGPTLVATRPFRDEQEKMEATLVALQGVAIGARPDFWQPYPAARNAVPAAARPATHAWTPRRHACAWPARQSGLGFRLRLPVPGAAAAPAGGPERYPTGDRNGLSRRQSSCQ